MSTNGRLSAQQEAFLLALVSGKGVEEAARAVNISSRTAYRWQRLEHFQEKLDKARAEAFDKKLAIMRDGIGIAIECLMRNMKPPAPPGVQVSAARSWIETAVSVYKMEKLENSISEIEHLLKEQGGHARVPTSY